MSNPAVSIITHFPLVVKFSLSPYAIRVYGDSWPLVNVSRYTIRTYVPFMK
jgi:hypothetical protein